MAEVQPFSALRYDLGQVGDLSDVIAPPYDVIDPEFLDRLYKQHPCNVVRVDFNRPEPDDASTQDRYTRAAKFFRQWQQDSVLIREHEDALYVYHQEFEWEGRHYVRRGFLGRIRLEEFGKGKVFPHEQTLSGPKQDRFDLMRATKANLSPVFGLYPDPDNAAQEPLEQAVLKLTPMVAKDHLGVIHKLWPVTDRAVISQVCEALADKPVFIADGHHRYETSCNYRNELAAKGELTENSGANYTLMMFVSMEDPGLAILPTHRLVSGFPELTIGDVQAALGNHFSFETVKDEAEAWELMAADGAQEVFGFGTAKDGQWILARATDTSPMTQLAAQQSDDWRGLGVSLLHKLVIEHLLGQKYPDVKPAFKFVHLMDEVTAAMKNKSCQLACLVNPAGIDHVRSIASQLEKMPPKSTYFYPKLLTGLVFHTH